MHMGAPPLQSPNQTASAGLLGCGLLPSGPMAGPPPPVARYQEALNQAAAALGIKTQVAITPEVTLATATLTKSVFSSEKRPRGSAIQESEILQMVAHEDRDLVKLLTAKLTGVLPAGQSPGQPDAGSVADPEPLISFMLAVAKAVAAGKTTLDPDDAKTGADKFWTKPRIIGAVGVGVIVVVIAAYARTRVGEAKSETSPAMNGPAMNGARKRSKNRR